MIGGNKTRKKAVGEKISSRFHVKCFCSDRKFNNRPINAPKNTTTTLSGKYWKPVSSIVWINKMPNAITHSTKNMAMELLCSCSTAFDSSVFVLFASFLLVELSIESLADDDDAAVGVDDNWAICVLFVDNAVPFNFDVLTMLLLLLLFWIGIDDVANRIVAFDALFVWFCISSLWTLSMLRLSPNISTKTTASVIWHFLDESLYFIGNIFTTYQTDVSRKFDKNMFQSNNMHAQKRLIRKIL